VVLALPEQPAPARRRPPVRRQAPERRSRRAVRAKAPVSHSLLGLRLGLEPGLELKVELTMRTPAAWQQEH
jgi:hypothetical protein